MDTDGSGTVTLDEFKRTMEERKKAIAARNRQQQEGTSEIEVEADAKAPPLVSVREMERAVSSIGRLDETGVSCWACWGFGGLGLSSRDDSLENPLRHISFKGFPFFCVLSLIGTFFH